MSAPSRFNASLNSLLREGWKETKRPLVPYQSWPAGARIVLERGDEVFYTVYSVYTDSSDWPGDDWPVGWTRARLRPVTLFDVEVLP